MIICHLFIFWFVSSPRYQQPPPPRYLSMDYTIDGTYFGEGTTFRLLNRKQKVVITITWTGKRYEIEDAQ